MNTKKRFIIIFSSFLIALLGWFALDSIIYKAFLPKEVQFITMSVRGNLDWSPTSTFITGEGFEGDRGFVFLWPVDSPAFQVISEYDYYGIEIKPALSPDGKRIAYLSSEESGIVILDLETRDEQVIPGWEDPAWSDNDRIIYRTSDNAIAYYDFRSMKTFDLYDFSPAREIWDIELSSDGNWLAVLLFSNSQDDPGLQFILLSIEKGVEQKINIDEINEVLGWSPDGQWVIYAADIGLVDIYAINILEQCKSERLDLSKLHAQLLQSLAWSPADDRIALSGKLGGDFGIFIIEEEFFAWPSIDQCTPIEFEG
jgi:WD40 repeat protein